ncbi:L-rhamnose mutarotase [Xylanimonas allomyrinae]|uniref:L-rhamnose mutarotase n=1 Tax=Xylanimonas allomyrinae TaxID=2509459 RepID=A0A4P6ENW6_9MICO|nr:L-rhamnose mutarotase [Xylanimonas allomyrinae]QAY64570.1 L-rhamnose mutarotase [Xylanimonas allomyrinae]
MARTMFRFRVRPDLLDEYREAHAAVWPEMLRALHETGWRNYSIFTAPDGEVIGYVESDDITAAREAMSALAVNERWQAAMARYFAGAGPDERLVELNETFHLETQLAAADGRPIAVDRQAQPRDYPVGR